MHLYVVHLSCYRKFPRSPVSFNLEFARFPCFYLAATARTDPLHPLRILQKAPADSNRQSRPTELNYTHYTVLIQMQDFWKPINLLAPRITNTKKQSNLARRTKSHQPLLEELLNIR